jgi:hypothetical protein
VSDYSNSQSGIRHAFDATIRAADSFAQAVLMAGDPAVAGGDLAVTRLLKLSEAIREDGQRRGHTMCGCTSDVLAYAAMRAAGVDMVGGVSEAHGRMVQYADDAA